MRIERLYAKRFAQWLDSEERDCVLLVAHCVPDT